MKKAEALEINNICPLHGPVLPENEPLEFYVNKYKTWSAYEPEDDGVAIVYASIHDTGTKQAAEKLAELFEAKGIKTGVTNLTEDDLHEGVGRCIPLQSSGAVRILLRCGCVPADASVPECIEHQGIPEAPRGSGGERKLGTDRRPRDETVRGRFKRSTVGRADGNHQICIKAGK